MNQLKCFGNTKKLSFKNIIHTAILLLITTNLLHVLFCTTQETCLLGQHNSVVVTVVLYTAFQHSALLNPPESKLPREENSLLFLPPKGPHHRGKSYLCYLNGFTRLLMHTSWGGGGYCSLALYCYYYNPNPPITFVLSLNFQCILHCSQLLVYRLIVNVGINTKVCLIR